MLRRRFLFSLTAAGAATAAAKSRSVGPVRKVFESPGPKPNGLQAADEGLWIVDQGDNHAYLVAYENGKVLRDLPTAADRSSGITFDGEAVWLASTYSRELIRADAQSGETIAKRFTPGAGVIYRMPTDPPGRRSPLAPPAPARSGGAAKIDSAPRPGTGAHGLEWRDGKLWVAVPPSRTIYRIDPQTWQVEHKFPTAGNRPHGIGWEGRHLWCTDSNLNAFFKHDVETGEVLESIRLADNDPLPHGMTIRGRVLWYCDDVGVVCRMDIG